MVVIDRMVMMVVVVVKLMWQGMGGMMCMEEDDLCSHDFSVSFQKVQLILKAQLYLKFMQSVFNLAPHQQDAEDPAMKWRWVFPH